ncbi:hypothetical protein QBC39DRAFT_64619 [Podospora conica]|nr:hypothetical protein QBC39DRAFT_64619 [Schizothecium conicum]
MLWAPTSTWSVTLQEGARNHRSLLRSMATELRILTNHTIRTHENIIGLIGTCWEGTGSEERILLPIFVYEASELGDLNSWLPQNPDITLGTQLDLCLGIARGVACLHDMGVVHCDLKPQNIVIFPPSNRETRFLPKIIDFNIAVLDQDVSDKVPLPAGTSLWNSPEQMSRLFIPRSELPRVDVFSLGVVLLHILTAGIAGPLLEFTAACGARDVSLADFKQSGSLAMVAADILGRFGLISGPDDDHPIDYAGFGRCWVRASILLCEVLDGSLQHRTTSAAGVVHVLQEVCSEAREHDLRSYNNPQIAHSNGEFTLVFENITGPPEVQRTRVEERKQEWRDLLNSMSTTRTNQQLLGEVDVEGLKISHETGVSTPWSPGVHFIPRKSNGDVVEAHRNCGIFEFFPVRVRQHILQELDTVYLSSAQSIVRRSNAAFQHAIISILFDTGQSTDEMIDKLLEMLLFAANNGHENSQMLFGWLHAVFKPGVPLPVPQLLELEWLEIGFRGGSRVSGERLKTLDEQRYHQVSTQIRSKYGGIGSEDWNLASLKHEIPGSDVLGRVWISATTNDETELRDTIPRLPRGHLDLLFGGGETPLMAACRSGHVNVVQILLESGASAAVCDDGGRGPLHHLSSFQSEDIPDIARNLVSSGADLEAFSWRCSDFSSGGAGWDSRYGHANGTPLAWAVQAKCIPAIQTLLELGAEVFPQPKSIPTRARRSGRRCSPIHWASRLHQSEILAMLLAKPNMDTPIDELLNSAWESMLEEVIPMLPLGLAVSYAGGVQLARILLHGTSHVDQCHRTVHLLLDAGALVNNRGHKLGEARESEFITACDFGPPHGLSALLTWHNGILRPDTRAWLQCLLLSCRDGSKGLFDELLAVQINLTGPYTWPGILNEVVQRTDDVCFINAIITKHQAVEPGPYDYSVPFATAWYRGRLNTAPVLFGAGWCDVIQGQRFTILGDLIWDAKHHPSHVRIVEAFIQCVGARDTIFEDVNRQDNKYSLKLNAIQLALAYRSRPGVSTGVEILKVLTRYFRHPRRHLGQTMGENKLSLLHMVVDMANPPATDFLLQLPGIDPGARSADGLTAFDHCILRWQNSARDNSLDYTSALEAGVPLEKAKNDWDAGTTALLATMKRRGASKYGFISIAVKRLSAEHIKVMLVSEEGGFGITETTPQEFTPFLAPLPGGSGSAVVERVANLPIGKCTFVLLRGPIEERLEIKRLPHCFDNVESFSTDTEEESAL